MSIFTKKVVLHEVYSGRKTEHSLLSFCRWYFNEADLKANRLVHPLMAHVYSRYIWHVQRASDGGYQIGIRENYPTFDNDELFDDVEYLYYNVSLTSDEYELFKHFLPL